MHMSRTRGRLVAGVAVAIAVAATVAVSTAADATGSSHSTRIEAHLGGFQEVPVINSTGNARFKATVSSSQIHFELRYRDLTGAPLFAHIHVGQRGVNGGIDAFLCGGGGKPACPASPSGKVTGTI